jgi:hypothetical protein
VQNPKMQKPDKSAEFSKEGYGSRIVSPMIMMMIIISSRVMHNIIF